MAAKILREVQSRRLETDVWGGECETVNWAGIPGPKRIPVTLRGDACFHGSLDRVPLQETYRMIPKGNS